MFPQVVVWQWQRGGNLTPLGRYLEHTAPIFKMKIYSKIYSDWSLRINFWFGDLHRLVGANKLSTLKIYTDWSVRITFWHKIYTDRSVRINFLLVTYTDGRCLYTTPIKLFIQTKTYNSHLNNSFYCVWKCVTLFSSNKLIYDHRLAI